jgi:hypothetical protein
MSFPFPDDRIALGRLDWCRAGKGDDVDGLSCVLRARMCAAHIEATQNAAWNATATPTFAELLAAAKVQSWSACPEGQVSGTCGLLFADRYGPPLWKAFGHERETRLYDSLLTGTPPDIPLAEAKVLPACVYPNDAGKILDNNSMLHEL